ncbi:MAG: DUF397 domain-containing protein [Streptosporangiaceae bacterium]
MASIEPDVDWDGAAWRKSSRSNNGGQCVEVAAVWRKSSRSNNGGQCVEVAAVWRKSSRSNNGGECVEVAPADAAVAVRDSKDPDGPRLAFASSAWARFTASLKAGRFDIEA